MEIQQQQDMKITLNACWKVSLLLGQLQELSLFFQLTNICSISHLVQEMVAVCINIYFRLKKANFEVSPTVSVYRGTSVSGK